MSRIMITMAALLLMFICAGQVSAEAGHLIAIEAFRYSYEKTGSPIVDLIIENRGKEAEDPLLAITLNEVVSSSQNDYMFRKRSSIQPAAIPTIMPGAKRSVTFPVDRLLKAGDYEARIEVTYAGVQEQNHFDFSVTDDEVNFANQNLKANHLNQASGTKVFARCLWLASVCIAVVMILLIVAKLSAKTERGAKKKEKQSGST
ncbi:hypothetical protein ACFPYJ_10075 [Paenibacillus solisilvae]|uniref:Uncharacterized protein n=1 Tax=Paenibacillus solisilvae TaxID=2486751 RepID=A0ABW0VW71_9BACL